MSFRSLLVTVFGSIGLGSLLGFFSLAMTDAIKVDKEAITPLFIFAIGLMVASIMIKNKEFGEI